MHKRAPSVLLLISAVILAVGGLMHARAYGATAEAVAASNLPAFYGSSLKALWLIDSATLIALALAFFLVARRPDMGAGALIMILALIPAATAAMLYTFIGVFLPAHLLLASALLAALAGALRARV